MLIQIRKFIFLIFLIQAQLNAHAQSANPQNFIVFSQEGQHSKAQIPTNGRRTEDVVVYTGSGQGTFFASGQAANNFARGVGVASQGRLNTSVESQIGTLNFDQLPLLVDRSSETVFAAIYPIPKVPDSYITALHALRNSHFKTNLFREKYKVFGFLDSRSGKPFDVALLIPKSKNINEVLAILLQQYPNSEEIFVNLEEKLLVQHLNVVDQAGELTLTQSWPKIISQNKNYLFLKNSEQSFLGPSSSGSLALDQNGNIKAITICLSTINNESKDKIIRAIKTSFLFDATAVELNQEKIDEFSQSGCDPYDGRRGGGDKR